SGPSLLARSALRAVSRLRRWRRRGATACGGQRRSALACPCLLVVVMRHHGGTPDAEGALASFEPHRGWSTGEPADRYEANPRAAGTSRASPPELLTLRTSPQRVPLTLHQAPTCAQLLSRREREAHLADSMDSMAADRLRSHETVGVARCGGMQKTRERVPDGPPFAIPPVGRMVLDKDPIRCDPRIAHRRINLDQDK